MKKYIKIDFVPHIGIGLGTQKVCERREILIFLPFITIQITIKNINKWKIKL